MSQKVDARVRSVVAAGACLIEKHFTLRRADGNTLMLPDPKRWLGMMGCAGPGKVYRLAQLVAATALSLEISASAAMATAGSENFFRAHFERGGMR